MNLAGLDPHRLPIVGVMGSGKDEHADRAEPLGIWLANRSVHLLTGGGGGVMTSVARAFCRVPGRRGLSLAIVPGLVDPPGRTPHPPTGYPNPWVEVPILTHLPLSGSAGTSLRSRNHLNVLTAHVVIALPGGAGTASEMQLAIRYRRPVAAFIDGSRDIPSLPEDVPILPSLREVTAFLETHLPAPGADE